jgi:serine O-acetyltransferase
MQLTLTYSQLASYAAAQMNSFFPDGNPVHPDKVSLVMPRVLERLAVALSGIGNPYFVRNGVSYFNHLHSDQYSMFLYLLGNEAHVSAVGGCPNLAAKSYLLNKALNGIEAYYEIQLPEVFWFCHPVGTVLGRASYGNGFVVMQGCTVGNKGCLLYTSPSPRDV